MLVSVLHMDSAMMQQQQRRSSVLEAVGTVRPSTGSRWNTKRRQGGEVDLGSPKMSPLLLWAIALLLASMISVLAIGGGGIIYCSAQEAVQSTVGAGTPASGVEAGGEGKAAVGDGSLTTSDSMTNLDDGPETFDDSDHSDESDDEDDSDGYFDVYEDEDGGKDEGNSGGHPSGALRPKINTSVDTEAGMCIITLDVSGGPAPAGYNVVTKLEVANGIVTASVSSSYQEHHRRQPGDTRSCGGAYAANEQPAATATQKLMKTDTDAVDADVATASQETYFYSASMATFQFSLDPRCDASKSEYAKATQKGEVLIINIPMLHADARTPRGSEESNKSNGSAARTSKNARNPSTPNLIKIEAERDEI